MCWKVENWGPGVMQPLLINMDNVLMMLHFPVMLQSHHIVSFCDL